MPKTTSAKVPEWSRVAITLRLSQRAIDAAEKYARKEGKNARAHMQDLLEQHLAPVVVPKLRRN